MNERQQFQELMHRLRRASDGAARELFSRYGDHVLLVVRRKLDRRLRKRFDSIDFTQDVWASFFAIPPERFTFEEPQALVAYLTRIAQYKVIERFRQQVETRKYNIDRESPLDLFGSEAREHPPVPEPGPEEQVAIKEQWERLLADHTHRDQQIIAMLRDNYSQREIAEQLRISDKTVRRVIQRLVVSSRS
ncbi:MAG: RNA polymerase sigma factor [Gemmataceae bacterium]